MSNNDGSNHNVDNEYIKKTTENNEIDVFTEVGVNNISSAELGDLNSYSEDYFKNNNAQNKAIYKKEEKWIKRLDKEERKRQKKISKRNRLFFRFVWMCMVISIAFLLSNCIMVGVDDMLAIKRQEENDIVISIPKDSKLSEVAKILSDSGVIHNSQFFTMYMALTKPYIKFTKGDYEVKTNMEYEEIVSYISTQKNRIDVKNVTFAEGLTVMQCADLLAEEGICNKDEFLELCNSSEFDEQYEFLKLAENQNERYYRLEGYLYPDTYKFYEDLDPGYVIKKFLSNYEDKIYTKRKIEGYQEKISISEIATSKNMTVDDLLILASMVQSEAADISDMKMIASIFLNRLNADVNEGLMYLNSDPTVFYPYKSKEELPIGFESIYDTYKHRGLPKGPICNPGMDAIGAVLNSEDTDYNYFCHDKEGKAYYAVTEYEHKKNLVKAGIN